MSRRKICVVTGSRADYGLLYWVMREIAGHPALALQVAVTGMHLSARHGETWRSVEQDGFRIDARVEVLSDDESAEGMAKAVGRGVAGFTDAFRALAPDVVLVLGDRFEIFAAAQAAVLTYRPIAHIAGGDVTEGAIDEVLRHCITKMSHLHFVTNAASAKRVAQLGEPVERIFNTGSPGLDYVKRTTLLSREELAERLSVRFRERTLLVTFHPATLERESPAAQFGQLLSALDAVSAEAPTGIVFTRPNADPGNAEIAVALDAYVAKHDNARAFTALGPQVYLSLMAQSDAVVGNSSSGLYEAPSLGVATVNIGDRQKGRLAASSVISVAPAAADIAAAIRRAMKMDCSAAVNPYGDGDSAARIVAQLAAVKDPRALLRKSFADA
jgi:UDP-hydrolysing UDP-N-acetyl-D-glucosamine 2-epimerase